MLDKPDLKKFWGEIDWQNDTIKLLHQKIKKKINSGINLNAMFKRIIMRENNVPKVQEYTLYDTVLELSYRDFPPNKKRDAHWFAVMKLLRGFGAKPACQLISEMSPIEKAKNEQETIRMLNHYWQKRKRMISSCILRLPNQKD